MKRLIAILNFFILFVMVYNQCCEANCKVCKTWNKFGTGKTICLGAGAASCLGSIRVKSVGSICCETGQSAHCSCTSGTCGAIASCGRKSSFHAFQEDFKVLPYVGGDDEGKDDLLNTLEEEERSGSTASTWGWIGGVMGSVVAVVFLLVCLLILGFGGFFLYRFFIKRKRLRDSELEMRLLVM